MFTGDNDDDFVMNEGYVFSVDTVAAVYGNADMDDKIDSKDVDFVQDIIDKKTTWDSKKNPYADAYKDGVIDQKDVDQINMIINKTSGDVWYQNYYGEAQKIAFPLKDKKIGVTYWQQAQLVDLLGHFEDIVAANASVWVARENQYDISNITFRYPSDKSTGSSKLTEEYCEGYATAGVDLIIGSPYKETVTNVANQYLPDVPVITLGIGGASCVSSALTLGILMDAEEKAQNYEKYVVDTIDSIKDKLKGIKDEDKPSMLICRMYADNDAYVTKYGGHLVNCANTDGSYQLLSMFANLYTDNSEKSTTPSRTTEWILSKDFDLIFDMEVYTGFQNSSIEGMKFYTQSEYNDRFENSVEYFKGTKAYKNGGVLGASYIFDGYSGFASLMMSAHMIYPDLFTLKEGQDSLQYWYTNFTNAEINVQSEGGYHYTGTAYKCQYNSTTLKLLNSEVNPTLNVCGNVNGDLVIDANDKAALEQMIADGTTGTLQVTDKVNLGDANMDGVVDENDVTYIQSIIDATFSDPVLVRHLNRSTNGDYWTESHYPTASFASTGAANMMMVYKLLGITSQIKAISYSGAVDNSLFDEYTYLYDSADAGTFNSGSGYKYRTGGSAGYFFSEELVNHKNNDKITAVIVADSVGSYLPSTGGTKGLTEAQVKDPEGINLDVIRIAPASTDATKLISDIALIGFFTKSDASVCSDLTTWYGKVIADLNTTLTEHIGYDTHQVSVAVSSANQYKVTGDTVTNYNYVSSATSDYTAVAIAAGASWPFEGDSKFKSADRHEDLGTWLYRYDIDKIVCIKTGAVAQNSAESFSWYDGSVKTGFGLTTVKNCVYAFKNTEAYYNNEIYVVCGDMPIMLRIVYTACVLYPDLFNTEWANTYNMEFCTDFLGFTEEQVNNGKFFMTMDDMGIDGTA